MVSNIENTCMVIGKYVESVCSRSDIYAHAITIARDKHYLVIHVYNNQEISYS